MSTDRSPTPRRTLPALALALVTGLAGCASEPDRLDALAREIELNRAVWIAQRPDAYVYVVRLRCFCIPAALRPVVVEVEGSRVVSRVYQETGEPVEAAFEEQFPAVDGLFAVLREAVETGADDVQVTFDAATGVPRELFIDYQRTTADEELGYTVTELPEPRP